MKKSGKKNFFVLSIYNREKHNKKFQKKFRGKIFSGYHIYKRENNKRKNQREITYIRERKTYIREETNKKNFAGYNRGV